MKLEYLGTAQSHNKVLIVKTNQRREKVGQARQVIEAIYKEEERKEERLSGETKRAKGALKKSSQRGETYYLTQGPEPVPIFFFFLSQAWKQRKVSMWLLSWFM